MTGPFYPPGIGPRDARPCERCGRLVLWLQNEETGYAAPLDAMPSAEGTLSVDWRIRTFRVAKGLSATAPRYTLHTLTCPNPTANR